MINTNQTISLSVMSGKGGVGKTNLALNLGYALYQAGMKLVLMDCDLGLANLDVLLGLSPDRNLQDLLQSNVHTADVLVPIEPDGLDILPAASGVPELVEMDEDLQEVLFDKLVELVGGYDFLLLDLGAGISNTVLSFAAVSQMRMVIVTPEPTSMTDSYALMKVLSTQHGVRDFLVVVNQAADAKEARVTFERLQAACRNFLGIEIMNLGYVRQDPAVVDAVRHQVPVLKHAPECPASKDIKALAAKFLKYRADNLASISARPVLKSFPDLQGS